MLHILSIIVLQIYKILNLYTMITTFNTKNTLSNAVDNTSKLFCRQQHSLWNNRNTSSYVTPTWIVQTHVQW